MAFIGRKAQILRAIVDDYIQRAEPIASKQLVNQHFLPLSSATIRNEMAHLEKEGYLEQPHTSAGRIPSDKGYRAYVDYLMTQTIDEDSISNNLRELARKEVKNISTWIKDTAKLLAFETGYTSIAISPHGSGSILKQIKLLFLEPGRALVLIVLAAGLVKDQIVSIPNLIGSVELQQITEAIESGLAGLPLEDITLVAVESCVEQVEIPENLLKQVLQEAYVAIKQAENLDTYIEGTHNLLAHKEFQEAYKFKNLMDILTKDGLVAGYINSEFKTEKVNSTAKYMIRIGDEIKVPGMQDCSFVTSTYEYGPKLWGTIGIVGPKRMDYQKVISKIQFVKHILTKENNNILKLENKTLNGEIKNERDL